MTDANEPTPADLAAVAALLDELERIAGEPATWSGGDRTASGSLQMPYAVYAPAAEDLLRAIQRHHLVVIGFDWGAWQHEAQRFLDPEVVRTASLLDLRRLLTLHVRQERFVEGHFAEMIRRGHIAAILRRLRELAAPAA